MDEPTPINMEVLPGSFSARESMNAITREVEMVASMMGRASLPFCRTVARFMEKPRRITAYCRTFLEVKATPGRKKSFPFIKGAIAMPIRIANTGPPMTGKDLPKNHAGADIIRQSRTPETYFFMS